MTATAIFSWADITDGRVSMMHLEADGSIGGIADGIFHKGIGRSIAQRNFVPHVDCVEADAGPEVSVCG